MSTKRELIPLEVIFGNPERAAPKISPDGTRLAWLAPLDGVLNIWVKTLGGSQERPLTRDRGRGIHGYFWAEDRRSILYVQDQGGDENWRLYQADLESGCVRDLTPHPGTQARIVGTDPNFPDHVLIALNLRDKRLHDAYKVDLRTGAMRLEAENPGNVVGWLADASFRVRCAKAMLPDGGSSVLIRDAEGAPWRSFMAWGPEDQGGAHGFTPEGKGLYIESNLGTDTTALYETNLDNGISKRLAQVDGADLGQVMLHPTSYHAEAVSFEKARNEWVVLDQGLAPDFEALSAASGGDFQIVGRDDADNFWVVLFNSDLRPARYHLWSRRERKAEFLFSSRPALEKFDLSPMEPVTIRSHDGLDLQAYLTLPAGRPPKGLPLVLDVHGGPWARDHWGFHPEAQWLADRGYAVLQVNFRGSTGFGKRFLHAGDRQWGAKMQDDLTDSVAWAVKEGWADPKRVAIYGGSYGGYAALAGAAFTPDLYRCAIDVVGPSNIVTLIRSIPPYWEIQRRIFDLRVGNVDTEREFLESRSPLYHADKINIPLLIAQGANDPRVKQAESEQVVAALRARGRDVDYMLFKDEGHGFARPENRLAFYRKAEEFLARHLGSP